MVKILKETQSKHLPEETNKNLRQLQAK